MGAVEQLRATSNDPVAGGFYTVREAARLLNIAQPAKIVGWLHGHKGRGRGPIIQRQYEPIEGAQELGFLDLIEVRFVEHFRKQDVSLQALRKAAATARDEWKQQHPFATSATKYLTDRVDVFSKTARDIHDNVLLNLVTKQYEMYVVLEEILAKGVEFDPASGLAREWRPKQAEFPDVVVSPLVAYGQPAVMPHGVPTFAIYNTWKAENGHYSATSDWYEIDEKLVRQAVEFELGLPD
jgi:uncharacterized protein (DUF433 family)